MNIFICIAILIFGLLTICYIIDRIQRKRFNIAIDQKITLQNQIEINHKAPVIEEQSIEINAPIDTIWKVLTSIDNWPNWQSNVSYAQIGLKSKTRATFKWKADGISFNSKIHTSIINKCFGWTGTVCGGQAIHNWYFIQQEDNVKIVVKESLQGLLVSIATNSFQRNLSKGMQRSLNELKIASEHSKLIH